jgi:hypothetical protein
MLRPIILKLVWFGMYWTKPQLRGPGACIIKLITAVINGFRNKLQRLSLNTKLGWKDLLGTNNLAYYGNR